jgi:hypothetical protein
MIRSEEEGLICRFCGSHIPANKVNLALLIRRECCEEMHEFHLCDVCLERSLQAISALSGKPFGKHPHACLSLRRVLAVYV